tara:strand:- start:7494 stop:7664 length:171 start_codon:yes stop_codon:yes gene_type:complete
LQRAKSKSQKKKKKLVELSAFSHRLAPTVVTMMTSSREIEMQAAAPAAAGYVRVVL